MIHPNLTEWPIQGAGDALPQPHGGVAPLRHDLALARYLEKQAAERARGGSRRDHWNAALRLGVRAVQGCLASLRALRALVPERRRVSIG